jgi:single-strand DNA-binding protein
MSEYSLFYFYFISFRKEDFIMGYNKVVMIGNCVETPELRYIASGEAVTTLRIAVNTRFSKEKEEVLFVDVDCWRSTAEFVCKYITKGREVLVEGRLKQRSWENKDGVKQYKMFINADNVNFVGKKPQDLDRDQNQNNPEAPTNTNSPVEDLPPF